uniref:sulfate transporter-like isoform X2 n=1 Tax=Myxine glutinosa TaxID=7769 RepID=UPI00358FDD1C
MAELSDRNSRCPPCTLLHRRPDPPWNLQDSLTQKLKNQCVCTPQATKKCLFNLFPVLQWLPKYKIKEWLLGDIMSGVIVGVLLVPQSIAYSLLAGQDPIYGLYSSFFACIIYFILGSSRHISVSIFGVLCLMIGQVVDRELLVAGFASDANDPAHRKLGNDSESHENVTIGGVVYTRNDFAILVGTTVTFVAGVYQVTMGIFQLGFVAIYLSEPMLSGFVTGASFVILTSQVKYMLGLHIPRTSGAGSLLLTWYYILKNIGHTNICDLITSATCLLIMVPIKEVNERCKKKMKAPFPIELVVIIIATLVSHFGKLEENFDSSIAGKIPIGFKRPRAPAWTLVPSVLADGIPIAIIGFAITVSLSEMFAKKHGYTIRPNQEVIAIGCCNLIPAFFYSFTTSAALAKTLIKEATGCQTQVSGLVTAVCLLLVLLVIAPLFYSLQKSVLAIVTVVNLRGAFHKFRDIPRMWRESYIDTIIWFITMLASALISPELGLLIGICISLLAFIIRTQWPRAVLLGRVEGTTDRYADLETYTNVSEVKGVRIFSFSAPLYYANKNNFSTKLHSKTAVNPELVIAWQKKIERKESEQKKQVKEKGENCNTEKSETKGAMIVPDPFDFHTLVLDFSSVNFLDMVGTGVVKSTCNDYQAIGLRVLIAGCNPSVLDSLSRARSIDSNDGEVLFFSVHEAVEHALALHSGAGANLPSSVSL